MSAADTGERIVESAAQLFAERGYAATTTRAIAERAGVNEVTLFRRFENKAGVLKALGERFADASAARAVHGVLSPDDAHATLLALARNEVATSIASGGVALRLAFDAATVPEVAALMGEGPASNVEAMAAYMAERQTAGQLRDDISPEVLAEAFATLTSSFVMYRMIMGFLPTPEDALSDTTVEQLFDIFWSGAAAQANGKQVAKREGSKR